MVGAMTRRRIDEIVIGERTRRDLGDIEGLAASINELGLLQPVVVRPDGRLIAGERRLAAAKFIGWNEIPIRVIDLDAVVRGEFAENTCRKDFTLSEAVAIKRALEPLEKAAAKERQREAGRQRGRGKKASGKLPGAKGEAADKAAKATGMARRTLEKAEAVVSAAEAEPAKFGKLLADMDRTGRVDAPFRRLNVMRQAERIRAEPPPLPGNGPYRVATIDIPWAAEPEGDADRAAHRGYWPYPTLTIEQACALPVGKIMADDSILWMWVTNFILVRGLHLPILKAWGNFKPKTLITWSKEKAGRGIWLRGQSEHAVMAVRGKPIVTLSSESTVLFASSMTWSSDSVRHRATPICSRALGTAASGIATATKRRRPTTPPTICGAPTMTASRPCASASPRAVRDGGRDDRHRAPDLRFGHGPARCRR